MVADLTSPSCVFKVFDHGNIATFPTPKEIFTRTHVGFFELVFTHATPYTTTPR